MAVSEVGRKNIGMSRSLSPARLPSVQTLLEAAFLFLVPKVIGIKLFFSSLLEPSHEGIFFFREGSLE